MKSDYPQLIEKMLPVALAAGEAILKYYGKDASVRHKSDGSPTTAADAAAETIIINALTAETPHIPIIAEEASENGIFPHIPDSCFWLIDPLDGTKEFLAGTKEFTVNIALIKQRTPVLGIIYAPATDDLFYGICAQPHQAAYYRKGKETQTQPLPLHYPLIDKGYPVIASRSHSDEHKIRAILGDTPITSYQKVGSSLKFCWLAMGKAAIYPRFGTTMEWDTAAGDAIVRAAGGSVLTPEGLPFLYQKENFQNGSFIARASGISPLTIADSA